MRPANGYECPTCHALPGQDCIALTGGIDKYGHSVHAGRTLKRTHPDRIKKYEQITDLEALVRRS